jgi:4-amino-4-deoxy-L-arabinose transferase-like glycosyltransferase
MKPSRPAKDREHVPQVELPTADRITLREIVLVAAVLAIGAAARLFFLSHAAVEHFDEGVYASNLYFGPPEYAYPQQRFYAPPLLPALIEAGMIAGLSPNLAALMPGFLAGCGTIVAVWWFGRSWFGAEVGLSGASLAALNDFHLTFSATALTDVLVGLWLVLAVDAIGRSLAGRDYRWAVAAGIYTGLAWWTKYNGWLPLAIEAATLPVLWFFLRPRRRDVVTWLGCLAVTCLVAAAVWSPYYFSLQSSGGYGPIAENHARYVVGLTGWLASAQRQITNQIVIGNGWTVLGLVLAVVLPQLLDPRRPLEVLLVVFQALITTFGVLLATFTFVLGLGAVVGIGRMAVAAGRAPKFDAAWRRRAVGLALIVVWWGAMLVATPLYTPYARLTLPLILAAMLAAALNWSPVLREPEDERATWQPGAVWGCLAVIVWLGIGFGLQALGPHQDVRERSVDRRDLVEIAQLVRLTERSFGQPRVIYVYGEPAIYFQLRAAGEPNVSPVQLAPVDPATSDGQPIPTLLIAGPHAHRDPQFQQQWAAVKDRWELIHEYEYQPGDVVWLDLNDPRRSPQETADLDRVRLYRLKASR